MSKPITTSRPPELGGPAVGEPSLEDLIRYPGQDGPVILPPLGVEKPFEPDVMPMIERFVLEEAQRVLFIYGENDPWSTNAFAVSASNDSLPSFSSRVARGTTTRYRSCRAQIAAFSASLVSGSTRPWPATASELSLDPSYRIDRRTRKELFLR
ncbi:MAG: hypothetical protein IPF53_15855 [Blastocatellia bacterium]|nr:hypothetical protein [Blastocatellia bacterium]